jgi:hypothetical protein
LFSDGHLTYLISFAQSFIHYHSIALKLGANLSKQEENGNFVFIDCLTRLLSGGGSSNGSASLKEDGAIKVDSSTASDSGSGSRTVFSLGRLGSYFVYSILANFFMLAISTPVNQRYVNCIKMYTVPLRVHYQNPTDQFVWLLTT